jgi:hypothetical protein
MAKVTHTAVTPPTGKRMGIVYNTVGTTFLARAKAIPVQPRTAAATQGTLAVSNAAALWNSLTTAQQDAWINPLETPIAAYNYFVQQNALAFQWGTQLWDAPPALVSGPGIVFASVYAEPDGVHTTLVIVNSVPSPPGLVTYCRLYLNYNQTKFGRNNSSAAAVYAGSYALTAVNGVNFFEFTDMQTALAGQWWYPRVFDTGLGSRCGNNVTGYYYTTDQFGRIYDNLGTQPTRNQFCGIEPALISTGVCPPLTTPPYPWPLSSVWYA